MTALAFKASPGAGFAAVPPERNREVAGDDATLTIGEVVDRAWEGLHRTGGVTGSATCPVCAGRMVRRGVVGECNDCGTRLF